MARAAFRCGGIAVATAWLVLFVPGSPAADEKSDALRLRWEKNYLTISGPRLPGGQMQVLYIEMKAKLLPVA